MNPSRDTRCWAVVPAAGIGRRMATAVPKQYLRIGGMTVLERTLSVLADEPRIAGIMVAVLAEDPWWPGLEPPSACPVETVTGGAERADSVLNALRALKSRGADDRDWVLVHDAARPCLRADDLGHLIDTLADDAIGGLLGVPVADTLKRVGPEGGVEATVDRDGLWRALTPQMFRLGALTTAIESARASGVSVTDEARAMEWAGHRPRIVEGSAGNLKITTAEDLALARRQLVDRAVRCADERGNVMIRTGFGYDAHRFAESGDVIRLGGVDIAHERGLAAHSDGDVAIHALCDALLGAAALGDIGRHFPDTDPRYRDADSRELLRVVVERVIEAGYRVGNVDLTIVAQAPRLSPHIESMRERLAADLGVTVDRVNVKATTTEGMGFAGRREGIASYAVVSIVRP